MSSSASNKLIFRPRARIIRTIGDQLISGPEAAVIELVKNSYDADASYVRICFVPPLAATFGSIIVEDDGHGMSAKDVVEKWMEPATSSKQSGRKSRKGRIMLGSKGIGRFAAAKLGATMALTSISEQEGQRTRSAIPELDWAWFEDDRYLSDVSIDFSEEQTTDPTGTRIEIIGLREAWSKEKMERLIVELRRLISPIQTRNVDNPFRIILDLSECTGPSCGFDGPALLAGGEGSDQDSDGPKGVEIAPLPLLASSDYLVEGYFDEAGEFHGKMEIRRAGKGALPVELAVPLEDGERPCGRVEVHFSIFDREADVIKDTMRRAGLGDITTAKARAFLDESAGVAIYRDGFRVRPYGNLENDWLSLDSRRVQDPSLRIGHNQIAGYVTVESQAGSRLVEKSSREGFEENAAFRRLRRLITRLLSAVVEPRRQAFRSRARLSRQKKSAFEQLDSLSQLKEVRKIIADLPPSKRKSAEKAIGEETAKLQQQIEDLKDRQRVLEAKSSLGLIVGEILHEGAPEATFLSVSASKLATFWKFVLLNGPKSDEAREEFPDRLRLMSESGERLRSLFASLRPLAGGRRTAAEPFSPFAVLDDTARYFETHNVGFDVERTNGIGKLMGHKEDLATALLNLFSNSVFWLQDSQIRDPKVRAYVEVRSADEVSIFVEDNGPGVPEEFAESIFDIRFTLKDDGTGLGLNIAQESLARSGGKLMFHPEFDGGARFEVRFPRYKEASA